MELKKYKLGEICNIIAGGDAPHNVTPEKTETNIIPVYSNGIIKEGLYGYTDKARITTKAFTVSARGTIGVSFLRNQPFFPIVRLLSVIPNSNDVDLDYLYYYSKLLRFEKDGSVQQQLTVPMLSNIEVRLLPYSTQRKVASILSNLDRKIALNRAINRNLEALAKQLYDYWFVQFDFPDENGRPYKSSCGKMVWDEALKREVPEGWICKTINEIESCIITGKTPPTADEMNYGGTIPFITIDDIRQSLFVYSTERTLSKKGADSQMKKYLPKGSLCCSCIGTVGIIGFVGKKSQTNQQINSIIFHEDFHREFLFFSLKMYFQYANAKTGNILSNMNKEEFSAIKMMYPSINLLKSFHNFVMPLFQQIDSNIIELQCLTKQRDELLPLLMNGQVTIE